MSSVPITHIALTDAPLPPDDKHGWTCTEKTGSGIFIWEARVPKAPPITGIDVAFTRPEPLPPQTEYVTLAGESSTSPFGLLVTRSTSSGAEPIVKLCLVKENDRVGGANWIKVATSLTKDSVRDASTSGSSHRAGAQAKEIAREFIWYQTPTLAKKSEKSQFNVGDWVDALDQRNVWCVGVIREIDKSGKRALIHYHGWADKWDTWIELKSGKVAPYRSKTQGETGWHGNVRGFQLDGHRNEFNDIVTECTKKLFEPMRQDDNWFPPTSRDLAGQMKLENITAEEIQMYAKLESDMCDWVKQLTNAVVPDPSYLPTVSNFFVGFVTYVARALRKTLPVHGGIQSRMILEAAQCMGGGDRNEQLFFSKYGVTENTDEELAKYCKGKYAVRRAVQPPPSAYLYKNINMFGEAGGFTHLASRFAYTLDACKQRVRQSVELATTATSGSNSSISITPIPEIPDPITHIQSYLVLLSGASSHTRNEVTMETVHGMCLVELLPWRFAAVADHPVEARKFDPKVAVRLIQLVGNLLKPFVSLEPLLEALEKARLVLALSLASSSTILLNQLVGLGILSAMAKDAVLLEQEAKLPPQPQGDMRTRAKQTILEILEQKEGKPTSEPLVLVPSRLVGIPPCSLRDDPGAGGAGQLFKLLVPGSRYSASCLNAALYSAGLLDTLLAPDAHLQALVLAPPLLDLAARCGTLNTQQTANSLIRRMFAEHVSSLPSVLGVLESFSTSLLSIVMKHQPSTFQPTDVTKAALSSLRGKEMFTPDELIAAAFCEYPLLQAGAQIWNQLNQTYIALKNESESSNQAESSSNNGYLGNIEHSDVLACLHRMSVRWIPLLFPYVYKLCPLVEQTFAGTTQRLSRAKALTTLATQSDHEHPTTILIRLALCGAPLLWQLAISRSQQRVSVVLASPASDLGSVHGSEEKSQIIIGCQPVWSALMSPPNVHDVLVDLLNGLRGIESTPEADWCSMDVGTPHAVTAKPREAHSCLGDQLREALIRRALEWLIPSETNGYQPFVAIDLLSSLVCGGPLSARGFIYPYSAPSTATQADASVDLWKHLPELKVNAFERAVILLSNVSQQAAAQLPQISTSISTNQLQFICRKAEFVFFLLDVIVRSSVYNGLASQSNSISVTRGQTPGESGVAFVLKQEHIDSLWNAMALDHVPGSLVQRALRQRFLAWIYRSLLKSAYIALTSAPPVLRCIQRRLLTRQEGQQLADLSELEALSIETLFSILNALPRSVRVESAGQVKVVADVAPLAVAFSVRKMSSVGSKDRVVFKCSGYAELQASLVKTMMAQDAKVSYSNFWIIDTALISHPVSAPQVAYYDAVEEVNFFRQLAVELPIRSDAGSPISISHKAIAACVALATQVTHQTAPEERLRLVKDLVSWSLAHLETYPTDPSGAYSEQQLHRASVAVIVLHTLMSKLIVGASRQVLRPGDRIFATWKGKQSLYAATVVSVDYERQTCSLAYDDNTFDSTVPLDQLRDWDTVQEYLNQHGSVSASLVPVSRFALQDNGPASSVDLKSWVAQRIAQSERAYNTILSLGGSKKQPHSIPSPRISMDDALLEASNSQPSGASYVKTDVDDAVAELLSMLPPPLSLRTMVLEIVENVDPEASGWSEHLSTSNGPKLSMLLQSIRSMIFYPTDSSNVLLRDQELEFRLAKLVADIRSSGHALSSTSSRATSSTQSASSDARIDLDFFIKFSLSGGLRALKSLLVTQFPSILVSLEEEGGSAWYPSQHDLELFVPILEPIASILLLGLELFGSSTSGRQLLERKFDFGPDVLAQLDNSIANVLSGDVRVEYRAYTDLIETCVVFSAKKSAEVQVMAISQPTAPRAQSSSALTAIHSAARGATYLTELIRTCEKRDQVGALEARSRRSPQWIRILTAAPLAASALLGSTANVSADQIPFVSDLVSYYLGSVNHQDMGDKLADPENFAASLLRDVLGIVFLHVESVTVLALQDTPKLRKLLPHLCSVERSQSASVDSTRVSGEPLARLPLALRIASEALLVASKNALQSIVSASSLHHRPKLVGLCLRVLATLIKSHPPLEIFAAGLASISDANPKQSSKKANTSPDSANNPSTDFMLVHLLHLAGDLFTAASPKQPNFDQAESVVLLEVLRKLRASFALELGVLPHLLGPGLFELSLDLGVEEAEPSNDAPKNNLNPDFAGAVTDASATFSRIVRAHSISSLERSAPSPPLPESSLETLVASNHSEFLSALDPGQLLSRLLRDNQNPGPGIMPSYPMTGAPLPQCKAISTRQAAFRLLWILIADDSACMDFTLQRIAAIHAVPPQGGGDPSDFTFAPSVPARPPVSAPAGLQNLGATCFANSILQQVCAVPYFVRNLLALPTDAFFASQPATSNANGDALYQLQRLALALIASEQAYYNPKEFFQSNFKMEGRTIKTSQQEDAEGFLQSLLDCVETHPLLAKARQDAKQIQDILSSRRAQEHSKEGALESLSDSKSDAEFEDANGENDGKTALSQLSDDELQARLRSLDFISHAATSVFGGETVDRFDPVCGHRRERSSRFWSIPVEVLGKDSLESALISSTAPEMLSDARCPKCNDEPRNTSKRMLIKKLPKTLIIVLKRFTMDYETFAPIKLTHRVKFPTSLDMYPYTKYAADADRETKSDNVEPMADENPLTREECQYRLQGIVLHRGELTHGHYISYLRRRNLRGTGSAEDSEWVCADDRHVYPWDANRRMEEDCFGGEDIDKATGQRLPKMKTAYVLVYDRIESSTDPLASNERELSLRSPDDLGLAPCSMTPLSRREVGGLLLSRAPLSLATRLAQENATFTRDKLVFEPSHFAFLDRLLRSESIEMAFRRLGERRTPSLNSRFYVEQHSLLGARSPTAQQLVGSGLAGPMGSDFSLAFSSYCLGLRFLLQTLARASILLAPTADDRAAVDRAVDAAASISNAMASPTATSPSASTQTSVALVDMKSQRGGYNDDVVSRSAVSSPTFRSLLAKLDTWFLSQKLLMTPNISPSSSFDSEHKEMYMLPRITKSLRSDLHPLRDALSVWILHETISKQWYRDILILCPDTQLRTSFANTVWQAYLRMTYLERVRGLGQGSSALGDESGTLSSLRSSLVTSLLSMFSTIESQWVRSGQAIQLLARIVAYSAQPCILKANSSKSAGDVNSMFILDKSIVQLTLVQGIISKLTRLICHACELPWSTSSVASWPNHPWALPSPGAYHAWTRVTTLLATLLEFCSGMPSGAAADSKLPLHNLTEEERIQLLSRPFVTRLLCMYTSPADSYPIIRILTRTHLLANETLSKALITAILSGIDEAGDSNLRSHLRAWSHVARFDDATYVPAPAFAFSPFVLTRVTNTPEQAPTVESLEQKDAIELVIGGTRVLVEVDSEDETYLLLTELSKQEDETFSEKSVDLAESKEPQPANLQAQRVKLLVPGLITLMNQRKSKYWRFTERCLEHLYRAFRLSPIVASTVLGVSSQSPSSPSGGGGGLSWAAEWLTTYGETFTRGNMELSRPMDVQAFAKATDVDATYIETLLAVLEARQTPYNDANIGTGQPGGPFWKDKWPARGKRSKDRTAWYSAIAKGAIAIVQCEKPVDASSLPSTARAVLTIPVLQDEEKHNRSRYFELAQLEEDSDEDDLDDMTVAKSLGKTQTEHIPKVERSGQEDPQAVSADSDLESEVYVPGIGLCVRAPVLACDDGTSLVMAASSSRHYLDSASDIHARFSKVVTAKDQAGGSDSSTASNMLEVVVGSYIDVLDGYETWRPAKVLEVFYENDGTQIALVKYLGMSANVNEAVRLDATRVARLGQYSQIRNVKQKLNAESPRNAGTKPVEPVLSPSSPGPSSRRSALLRRPRYPFAHTSPLVLNGFVSFGEASSQCKSEGTVQTATKNSARAYVEIPSSNGLSSCQL